MLLDWVVGPVIAFVTTIIGLLPTANTSFFGDAAGTASQVGGYASEAAAVLPVGLLLSVLYVVVVVVIPAVFVYELAQWGYRELPEIAGFGS